MGATGPQGSAPHANPAPLLGRPLPSPRQPQVHGCRVRHQGLPGPVQTAAEWSCSNHRAERKGPRESYPPRAGLNSGGCRPRVWAFLQLTLRHESVASCGDLGVGLWLQRAQGVGALLRARRAGGRGGEEGQSGREKTPDPAGRRLCAFRPSGRRAPHLRVWTL